jgi:RNA polymerase sigma-70 factor, ECF subfamily
MTSQGTSGPSAGEGSESFASHIFRIYSQQLLQLANEQFDKSLSSKISPEDVVQSALKSFFRRAELLQVSPANHDMIWGLLSIITVRKCNKWKSFYRCEKRDVQRESISANDSSFDLTQAAFTPQAQDALIATELIEHLLRNFTTRQQEMIVLRIQGHSSEQIAAQCQSSLRTVARTMLRAKSILAGLLLDE